jgi:hypothetical protein
MVAFPALLLLRNSILPRELLVIPALPAVLVCLK